MNTRRDAVLERARSRALFTSDDEARAAAACAAYRRFGVELHVADALASLGLVPADEMEEAARGEEIPSRIAGLEVVRLAGGTAERPVLLARRALDGETFLVHACMRSRSEAPGEVDAFVRAMEDGRRLTGSAWIPVREAGGADGAYAAVSAVPEGIRLEERLATRGALAPDEAVTLLKRIGEALWPLEALGRAAVFPDPSLVLLDGQGRPCLVAMELLLASRSGGFDASELARSAANFLARLVGPERLHDPAVRDLMADLSSGRLEPLRPESASRRFAGPAYEDASSRGPAVDDVETIDLSASPSTPVFTSPLRSSVTIPRARPAATPLPSRRPVPAWVWGAGLVAVGGIAFGVLRGGDDARTPTVAPTETATPPQPRVPGPVVAGPAPAPASARDPGPLALEEALGYLATHRDDDPQGVLDRLRSVEARYGGTDAGTKAASEREQFLRETEGRAEREAQAIGNDVDRLLAGDELGAAYAALDRFPRKLAFTRASMRIDVLRDRVKEKAEAVYGTLRPRIEAASEPGRQDDARAAFERVKSLGVPELTQRAEQRLRDALDRATGKAAQRKKLEPALDAAVGETLAAAGQGETDRARQAADALARGPLGDAFPDRAKDVRESVDRIVRTFEAAAGEWRARAGKTATVTLREYGAKPFAVTPGDASGDRLTWTRGGVAGGVRVGAIDPDVVATWALAQGRDQDGAALLGVATLFAAAGRYAEADAAAAKAQALGATAPSLAREAAAVRAQLGALASREVAAADALAQRDREAAKTAYGRAAVTAPFWAGPHRRLAEAWAADKKAEEALTEWRRAAALGDASPDVLHGIAKASGAAGRPEEETLVAWRAFLAAAPASDARLEAARAEADRLAVKVVRGSTLDRVKTAKALLDAGKVEEALAALEEAVHLDPGSVEAQRALARAAEKGDDPLRAQLAWRAAHQASKNAKDAADAKEQMDRLERLYGERPPEALVRKSAEEAAAKGEYAGAAETYRRAIGMSPLDVEARLGLGGALLGLGLRASAKEKLEESQAAYDVAVRMAPEDARGYAGRAEARRYRGDLPGAIADATEAINRRKDLVQAYNTRALAQYQSLQYDAALGDLSVVTTLAPLLATPRITRAGVYAVLGRYDEAEADLAAALERNPTPAERAQITALREQLAARKKVDKR